jgi:hypothetical protein
MKLVQINYLDRGKKWCLVDESGTGEYTSCGNAWTDSTMKFEDFEFTGKVKEGKEITCKNCKRTYDWYRSL